MINQNILNYYGSKLDAKLDSSEYYDVELAGSYLDYNENLLDFTTGGTITYSGLTFDSDCLTGITTPLVFEINKQYTGHTCDFLLRRRTELGWTIDMVFNKNGYDWSDGNTFYYFGISGETLSGNYLDNNFSLSFTDDGKIMWSAFHYSGHCNTISGYTTTEFITTGQTETLPSGSTIDDFNITITFQRNRILNGCEIANDGGWNDLINETTVTNINEVLTGATEIVEYVETLNQKWENEQNERMGTLKFYLNGKKIYSIQNWEEIIPSQRGSENLLIQKWGGGTVFSGGLHNDGNIVFSNDDNIEFNILTEDEYGMITEDDSLFNILRIKYYEQPLNFVEINHLFQTTTKPYFNITNNNNICLNDLIGYDERTLKTENFYVLLTEKTDLLLY